MTGQTIPPGQTLGQPGPAGSKAGEADPSMEDILASIRRILDDETAAEPAAPAGEGEVLELTEQMLAQDDGGKVGAARATAATAAASPSPPPAPEPTAPSVPAVATSESAPAIAAGLVGAAAAGTAAASFAALRAASASASAQTPPRPETPVGHAALTLEEMVRQELRPLLRGWLDENLPPLVERLVKAELERIARG